MNYYLIVLLVTLLGTLRAFLIVAGMYKDPILRSFEHYGTERIYSPVLHLTLWVIASLFMIGVGLVSIPAMFGLALVLALLGAYLTGPILRMMREHPEWFRALPRWYAVLNDRTDRHERRRIAYLWLRLPGRTRLLYNARSEYFEQWVDQVLMTIA